MKDPLRPPKRKEEESNIEVIAKTLVELKKEELLQILCEFTEDEMVQIVAEVARSCPDLVGTCGQGCSPKTGLRARVEPDYHGRDAPQGLRSVSCTKVLVSLMWGRGWKG